MGICSSNEENVSSLETEIERQNKDFANLPKVTIMKDDNIEEYFEIERELGRGGSCRVLKVKKKSTGELFALKELLRNDQWNPKLFAKEIAILTNIEHPNILSYREAYVGTEHFFLCTKLCTGGELFNKIKKLKHFSEKKAAEVLKIILKALAHIHKNQIVHRDLKPENIVYDNPFDENSLVIIDLGDAEFIESDTQIFSDFVGTPFYLAPECIRHRSGWELYKSDMWAMGVIAYVLLTGRPPFWGQNNHEILTKITQTPLIWPTNVKLSRSCKDFINSLLNKDPRKRLSVEEALQHPWIVSESVRFNQHLGEQVLKNLANFVNACKLKKLIVTALVNDLSSEDRKIIATAFREVDIDGNGFIDRSELVTFLVRTGMHRIQANVRANQLIEIMDKDGDGRIDLQEFTLSRTQSKFESNENLIKIQFEKIDENHDGKLTKDEIKKTFGNLIEEDQLNNIMTEIDVNEDGYIDMDTFKRAMTTDMMSTEQTKNKSNKLMEDGVD